MLESQLGPWWAWSQLKKEFVKLNKNTRRRCEEIKSASHLPPSSLLSILRENNVEEENLSQKFRGFSPAMCVPNINPSMASTTCILASTPSTTTAASRARHFSAPANFVKPTTTISNSPKLLISSSCRMQRSCRLIRPKSKEVGDSPSDSSAIITTTTTVILESSNTRNNHHYLPDLVPYNPASTTMVQCQITCRPTPSVISRENKKSVNSNHFMSEKEEEACCWNNYNNKNIVDPKTPIFNSNNKNNKFPEFHPTPHPIFNPNVSSPAAITQKTNNNHYHHSSDDHDRNVRLKNSLLSSPVEHFRNYNAGNGNSCLWNDSSGGIINFVNPEDHSWNSGWSSTTTTKTVSRKNNSKKSCQNQNIITSSYTNLEYRNSTTTTAILSNLDPRNNSRSSVISRENSRSWLLLCFSLTLLLSLCVESTEATKICHSMNIAGVKGDAVLKKFENLTDCTIIEGHLIVASFQEKDNFTLTFPNLREVTEYVVFYEAENIVKLDQMFPNLAVIRGNKLLSVRLLLMIIFNSPRGRMVSANSSSYFFLLSSFSFPRTFFCLCL